MPRQRTGSDICDMTRTLIVGEEAEHYAELLAAHACEGLSLTAAADPEVALQACGDAEVLFGPPDALLPLLPQASALRWVQSSWAGVRPLLRQPRQDFLLTGVKGIFGPPMAEFVLGWLLALERRIIDRAHAGAWDGRVDGSLAGKTLGIMGTGSIGAHVARCARVFGLSVRGLNRRGLSHPDFDQCYPVSAARAFAEELDYLVALLPDTPESSGLIDDGLLAQVAAGAILINAGRASSLDEPALVAALERGKLRAAVLDVFQEEPLPTDSPLWALPDLYITSHTAAPTRAEDIVAIFADNLRRYQQGEELNYLVDFEQGY